jgi:predicted PurR-regulated permease PerM
MAQSVTNIGDRRPGQEQIAQPNLSPPEVAVPRAHPRRKDWALHAIGIGATLAICYFGEETLVTILVSVLLAFMLAPVADLFVRLRLPRWFAAAISVGLLIAALGAAGFYGLNQAAKLLSELPKYSGEIRQKISRITSKTHNLQVLAPAQGKKTVNVHETTNWTDLLSHGFGSATEVVLTASFIPFLAFFMLTWQDHARAATVGLFPPENRREAHATLGQISRMVRSFIVGNLLIGLLIGSISTTVFGFSGIPFFFFVGFASGFLSLVPYLGVILALLPPLFVGIAHLTWPKVSEIVLTVFILHIVSLNVLYPKFLGGRLRLNPLAVTIALLVWAWLWGAAGLVLAVPITAGMKIVCDHVESLKPFGVWLGEHSPLHAVNGQQ